VAGKKKIQTILPNYTKGEKRGLTRLCPKKIKRERRGIWLNGKVPSYQDDRLKVKKLELRNRRAVGVVLYLQSKRTKIPHLHSGGGIQREHTQEV